MTSNLTTDLTKTSMPTVNEFRLALMSNVYKFNYSLIGLQACFYPSFLKTPANASFLCNFLFVLATAFHVSASNSFK